MIEIEGITFAYEDNTVLQDISFKIEKGEKVILLGVNGSGKSTLLKLLDGLIFPKSGRYAYQNTKITKKQLKESTFSADFRSKVVLLFQNPDVMIFNPTVYDEISFGLKQLNRDHIDERVNFWADKLGITQYLEKPPFHLSSGEKQKVCLASLLVLEPELLLLDEPASNLDPLATGWLVDFLGELEETVIITTHNLSLSTELGKRSLVLSRDHRLIYDGDLKDFLTDSDKLIEAHLMHTHKHKHGQLYHKHFHIHDWD